MANDVMKKAAPLIPAITTQPGSHRHLTEEGREWQYVYDIHAAGTRSERRIGWLHADGLEQSIAGARPGDRIATPWGEMVRTADSLYERGFLLERTPGAAVEPGAGAVVEVPAALLARAGRWTSVVGPWSYEVVAAAMDSRSERRIGSLTFGGSAVEGRKQGDHVDTPWGRLRWLGPVNLAELTDYEQGLLLRGTGDRPLDHLEGDPIFPGAARTVLLASAYLDGGFRLGAEGRAAHWITLQLVGRPLHDTELAGSLVLDPNQCSLNDFGDRTNCTKMAVHQIDVQVTLMRLADPMHLKRRFFSVTGGDLPHGLALIVGRTLDRCHLKLERQVVPLTVAER